MGNLSYVLFFLSILLILVLLKQFLTMWIMLDRLGLKVVKYILPILEIFLLIFKDGLFLMPSVLTFLFLLYDGRVFKDHYFRSYYHMTKGEFIPHRRGLIVIVTLAPLLFIGLYSFNEGIRILLDSMNGGFVLPDLKFDMTLKTNIIGYVANFILVCIIAPIVEEFVFRTLIYKNWLAKRFNNKILTLTLASLLFTYSHFNINTVVYTFITGMILCLVYDFYGYIASVLLHGLLNFFIYSGISHILLTEWSTVLFLTFLLFMVLIIVLRNKKPINKEKYR